MRGLNLFLRNIRSYNQVFLKVEDASEPEPVVVMSEKAASYDLEPTIVVPLTNVVEEVPKEDPATKVAVSVEAKATEVELFLIVTLKPFLSNLVAVM